MRRLSLAILALFVSVPPTVGQSTQQQTTPPGMRNHHILLSPSGAPGTGETLWIAVTPDGQLAILPVSQLQAKLAAGYRPYTFGEFQDALTMLMSQNAALSAGVTRSQPSQSATVAQDPRCLASETWFAGTGRCQPNYNTPTVSQSPTVARSQPTAGSQATQNQYAQNPRCPSGQVWMAGMGRCHPTYKTPTPSQSGTVTQSQPDAGSQAYQDAQLQEQQREFDAQTQERQRQFDAQMREQQRQARQAALMFLMGQQTQRVNMNVNVTDCTKYPALCVNH